MKERIIILLKRAWFGIKIGIVGLLMLIPYAIILWTTPIWIFVYVVFGFSINQKMDNLLGFIFKILKIVKS